jgi:hypothetical protein
LAQLIETGNRDIGYTARFDFQFIVFFLGWGKATVGERAVLRTAKLTRTLCDRKDFYKLIANSYRVQPDLVLRVSCR